MMAGVDFGEFQRALVSAFSQRDLETLVRTRLDTRLEDIVSPGTTPYVAYELLDWAERKGSSVVLNLARAAYLENPRNEAIGLIYEKFGMAPAVSVQEGGVIVAGSPRVATARGLEAIVQPRLKAVDMDVWREKLAQVEGQVCRIELNGEARGTGFLVGPDLVLTNYHVLEDVIEGRTPAAAATCRFDYKVLADRTTSEGVTAPLHARDWLIDSSRYSQAEKEKQPSRALPTPDELDFALVRLARPLGGMPLMSGGSDTRRQRGWIPLPTAQPHIDQDMPLLIPQHPNGAPVKLAIETNGVLSINANGTRVRYRTNTDHGSSGSPCFSMDWELVALHHMGDPDWLNPKYNEGVPIGVIRERLAAKIELPAT
jgi:hypothetical protein